MSFNEFFLLKLDINTAKPIIVESYKAETSKIPHNSLMEFCFPDLDYVIALYQAGHFVVSMDYTFTLTDEDGVRQFGFCHRFDYDEMAHCFCVLSDYPLYEYFYTLLDKLQYLLDNYHSIELLPRVLDYFYQFEVPKPGSAHAIKLVAEMDFAEFANVDYGLELSPFGNADFTGLIENMGVSNIISVLSALYFERRIIFYSDSLERLSECLYASLSMLFPFSWHLVLIPMLPKSMLSFAMAPMPFIIGVHSSLIDEVQQLPLEQVVFVDIDSDQCHGNVEDSLCLPVCISSLRFVLESEKVNFRRTGRLDNTKIYRAFQQFYLSCIGYYQFYLHEDEFNTEEFINGSNHPKFLHEFCQTLMFSQFIEERKKILISKQDLLSYSEFDQKCYFLYRTSEKPAPKNTEVEEDDDDLFSFKGIKKKMMNVIKKTGGDRDEPLIDFSSFTTLPTMSPAGDRMKKSIEERKIHEEHKQEPKEESSSSEDALIDLSKTTTVQYHNSNPFAPKIVQNESKSAPPPKRSNPFGPPIYQNNNPFL
eukprot:TRINITY_DN9299_c0_g1_i1.p1 TRINITY_DN9299_c0_g1~~TRINITY_DN9299_c0_g1_i1.p1  ORF type:complete len:543 (-),score=94.10 TRINITY_DN9299_c0_g1_i1:22-1626(-)